MSLLSRLAVQAARAYGILSSNKNNVSASYLAVAGGGGGGSNSGGGAGAGGYQTSTFTLSTLNTYSITVGAGGAGGASGGNNTGSNGSDSIVSGTGLTTLTSTGGGGGGKNAASPNGSNGGSGGGAGSNGATLGTGGTGVSGQGFAGGTGATDNATYRNGGGGGGASAVGSNATSSAGGAGGNGSSSSISGSSITYAGGGGGASFTTGGAGGTGGGGAGTGGTGGAVGGSGTTNLGGGGGGGAGGNGAGGAGGSGIVIISYASATPRFVGGTLTTSGGNQIHTFTSSGTLSPLTPVTASYLVVAGGAGGGGNIGGGGGAGGLLTGSTTIYSGATYVVTVGAGGNGGSGASSASGSNGSNSVLSGTGLTTLTATSGGGGGGYDTVGTAGGSGGGGGGGGVRAGGTGTSGQGNNGGSSNTVVITNFPSGGGGGASAVGTSGVSGGASGAGGAGTASSISGTSITYAGGGGGGAFGNTAGAGGAGGGGAGVNGTAPSIGISGTTNLGGGGGGGSAANGNGGAGGSGIVIISYAGSQVFNGGLVTSSGGNTIHTFNATGALTPLTNNLTNSLRFRASASARLTRTFASTGTNNKIQTFSAWVKRGLLSGSTDYRLMGCYDGSSSNSTEINFDNDNLRIEFGGAANNALITTQVFRDPSAWYHIVIAIDTTQATAANRIKMYVNGNQITAFGTANYPAQNAVSQLTSANANNSIGSGWSGFEYFDGYMTDINFIDGQALEPYYFGNNDANGVWKPIKYTGMYGTNGFYLTFADTTSTTTLGYDSSGNNNNWTTNNISLTAGTTYDAMLDVPTNTSATVANYCVANPLNKDSTVTVTDGNLAASASATNVGVTGSIAISSGKWYWEITQTAGGVATSNIVGITDATLAAKTAGLTTNSYGYGTGTTAFKWNAGTNTAYGVNWTNGDVIGVAFDADAGSLTFYKNGSSQGTAFTGISGTFYPAFGFQSGSAYAVNFGQRPFAYTPPTGFVALNTFNLPTPTILQGNKYMDATLYTGIDGVSGTAVNAGQFKPDLVWAKSRGATGNNVLSDSNRGVNKTLYSNLTNAEVNNATELTAFNNNGFSHGTSGDWSNGTLVAWQWQAGQGTNTSNTSGSITSTVSVNTTAGFSIVTYTGTGANATVGHGLGVAPKMVITKKRSSAGDEWVIWHTSLTSGTYILLFTTAAQFSSTQYTAVPSSTVLNLNTATAVNNNGSTYVSYCWAEIAGFSKFGSYTGNGSADGPFTYTGFRPKFIMIKCTDTAGTAWIIYDTTRDTYNVAGNILLPNSSSAELTGFSLDILSNGFKQRQGGGDPNATSRNYIYAAFAENPFKISNAR